MNSAPPTYDQALIQLEAQDEELYRAIELGDKVRAEKALHRGARLDYKFTSYDWNVGSPLILAIYYNRTEIVELLLGCGADPRLISYYTYEPWFGEAEKVQISPLDLAEKKGNEKIIRMLRSKIFLIERNHYLRT